MEEKQQVFNVREGIAVIKHMIMLYLCAKGFLDLNVSWICKNIPFWQNILKILISTSDFVIDRDFFQEINFQFSPVVSP